MTAQVIDFQAERAKRQPLTAGLIYGQTLTWWGANLVAVTIVIGFVGVASWWMWAL